MSFKTSPFADLWRQICGDKPSCYMVESIAFLNEPSFSSFSSSVMRDIFLRMIYRMEVFVETAHKTSSFVFPYFSVLAARYSCFTYLKVESKNTSVPYILLGIISSSPVVNMCLLLFLCGNQAYILLWKIIDVLPLFFTVPFLLLCEK